MEEVHISSLVVHAEPTHLEGVKAAILALPGSEIYGDDPHGKIVVVMTTENQGFITTTIDKISNLEHVLNVALVYHHIEKETETFDKPINDLSVEAKGDV
ncbi:nitrate reductase (plasmid) [Vibrio sp. qd031]|jgi:nitrate reductase NapD|uniref:chaperone NapD n=1 Tax=Vibrio sp. qd031 TaxID=1603038 RepID=UPI000A1148FA|nr:chaperone NapD [Vibrio sp. qd031]ORT52569.1 nitrate reductase [Vibrio sp. qd031]